MLHLEATHTMLTWAKKRQEEEKRDQATRDRNSQLVTPLMAYARHKTHRVAKIEPNNIIRFDPLKPGIKGGRMKVNQDLVNRLRQNAYVSIRQP